jgi:hypothetical protein
MKQPRKRCDNCEGRPRVVFPVKWAGRMLALCRLCLEAGRRVEAGSQGVQERGVEGGGLQP